MLLCLLFTAERVSFAQEAQAFAGVSLVAGFAVGRWRVAAVPIVVLMALIALNAPLSISGDSAESWAVGGAFLGVALRKLSSFLTARRRTPGVS